MDTRARFMSRFARILFPWLDGALLVGFLAGAVSAYLDPASYWFCAPIAVGLPLLAGLLLAIGLVLWRSRRPLAILHLVLAVGVVPPRHLSLERVLARPASDGDLVLVTWNNPVAPSTNEATEETSRLVRELAPDLIGLQETVVYHTHSRLWVPENIRPLVESLGYSMNPADSRGEGSPWRQPLLARFPLDDQAQHSYRRADRDWPQLDVLRTELTWQHRKIAHYNVHLSSHAKDKPWSGDGHWLEVGAWLDFIRQLRRSYRIRSWQVERIRELIEAELHPVVLSGDFNGTPDSWVYRRLSRGLQDAYRAAGTGWGATYYSSAPMFRIDFVLLGPEFEASSAEVRALGPEVSDHRPLVVGFHWRPPDPSDGGAPPAPVDHPLPSPGVEPPR
jgi:endonuclease/exonuclease/phosphatase family metal-dependent hydrolase